MEPEEMLLAPSHKTHYTLELKDFYPGPELGGFVKSLTHVNIVPRVEHSGTWNKYLSGVDRRSVRDIGAQIIYVASDALKELKNNPDVEHAFIEVYKKLEGPPTPLPMTKEAAEEYRLTDDTIIHSGVMMRSTRESDDALSSKLNDLFHEALGLTNYAPVTVDILQKHSHSNKQVRMDNFQLEKGVFYLGEWTYVE